MLFTANKMSHQERVMTLENSLTDSTEWLTSNVIYCKQNESSGRILENSITDSTQWLLAVVTPSVKIVKYLRDFWEQNWNNSYVEMFPLI